MIVMGRRRPSVSVENRETWNSELARHAFLGYRALFAMGART